MKSETYFWIGMGAVIFLLSVFWGYSIIYELYIRPPIVDAFKVNLEDRGLQVVDARMNSPIVTVFLSEEEFLDKAAALNATTIYFVSRGDFYIIDNGVGYLHIVG